MSKMSYCGTCGAEVFIGEDAPRILFVEKLRAGRHNVPFYCDECGAIKSPIRVLNDSVLLYPFPDETKLSFESDIIHVPESYKEYYPSDTGVIVACGKGYFTQKGKWKKMPVEVGDLVKFDKTVPWKAPYVGTDGNTYYLKKMGSGDILGFVELD